MKLATVQTMDTRVERDPYADLIAQYGACRIEGLLSGTHMIVKRKGPSSYMVDWLRDMTVDEMWHDETMSVSQRGAIYRAGHSLDYALRVKPADKVLGEGTKGIVIERVK